MKDEALKLALEALEAHADIGIKSDKAITAIKQALAAPVQPVAIGWDTKTDTPIMGYTTPPAQPAPVQPKPEYKFCDDGKVILKNPEILSQRYRDTTPPAQPAPVQECLVHGECFGGKCIYTTPPAQPAVPDAIGPNEDELPAYAAGWNDCRQAMLEMMK